MRTGPASTNDVERFSSDAPQLVAKRGYDKWIVPGGFTATFVLFAVAVHLRLLDNFDVAVRDVARPGDVWGPVQIRAARVAGVLNPAHLALPLLLVVAALSLFRRSLRPFWVMAVVGLPVVLVTVGTKWAMSHWDPSTAPVGHGSFPSGHTVAATTSVGVVVLLLRPSTRWGWMLPAAMGGGMGSALVLASVHPATDVLGADLLAAAALTGATAATLGQWARGSRAKRPMTGELSR